MRRHPHYWLLALVIVAGCPVFGLASDNGTSGQGVALTTPATVSDGARELAAQVREIAHSKTISRTKKEKRISTAVRVAVVAATAYKQNPGEVLQIGIALASAAAQAAPSFADAIINATVFAPAIARIDGATAQIRTAAFSAAKGPGRKIAADAPAGQYAGVVQPRAPTTMAPTTEPAPTTPIEEAQDENLQSSPAAAPGSTITWGRNSSINFTAEAGARYDDNVFWTKTNKVGDTIVSLAPGAEYQFGQNSLGHGSIRYREMFSHYMDNTVPNANLGLGAADFGFSDDKLTLAATSSFNQLNQNNPDILAQGKSVLLRTDVFAAAGSAEVRLSSLLSAKAGGSYTHTDYKTAGLISSQHTDWPLSLYFQATPKLDISTGFTYGVERPDGGGPSGEDLYYSLCLRGSLTPKVTTEFSVGEQTQSVANNPRQNLLGFNGSFNCQLTPNTNCVLALSRGFNAGALGQSLVNSSYRLGFVNDLTPQLQVGTNLSYRSTDYGPTVYVIGNLPVFVPRTDHFWEGSLDISYEFSEHFKAGATYTFRINRSNDPGVEFANNVIGLVVDLRY